MDRLIHTCLNTVASIMTLQYAKKANDIKANMHRKIVRAARDDVTFTRRKTIQRPRKLRFLHRSFRTSSVHTRLVNFLP